MKIGILTQPLHNNYGGLLQCFALQTVLKRMGHEPWVIERVSWKEQSWLNSAKNIVKFILGKSDCLLSNRLQKDISRYTHSFVETNISPRTLKCYTSYSLKQECTKMDFGGYVVGSDQVWRPCYSPCITNYFLDFAKDWQVRKIAYAASFGVDEWEFSKRETAVCSDLLRLFDAVSVRESSGVELCQEYLNRFDAVHVLDPTMLLNQTDYEKLVHTANESKSSGSLFCYILDEAVEKRMLINEIAEKTGLIPFTCMPDVQPTASNIRTIGVEPCTYPSPTKWLRSFMDAKMVVTDSFHGCAFSIIFNKPFWVIGNKERGMSRFSSLLKLFALESRLINLHENISFSSDIDWAFVNELRQKLKMLSMDFLSKHCQ